MGLHPVRPGHPARARPDGRPGDVTFRSRLTDYLNSTDLHFIPLVRAEILPHDSTAVGAKPSQ